MRDLLTSPRMEDMKRKRHAYVRRLSILITILVIRFCKFYFWLSFHLVIDLDYNHIQFVITIIPL